MAKPFVKWVGGKTQLLEEIQKKYPAKITKYCEPFVGGGAVLFDILKKFHPKTVLINDINAELVNCYRQIKTNVSDLVDELSTLQANYLGTEQEWRKDFFIRKRERYNSLISKFNESDLLEKAALFIFLNKTCFNGLYRVNGKGLFNVPFNNAKKPAICDKENLIKCSELLQNVQMTVGDYSQCSDFIEKNTFVYLDPPYRPLTETSSFTSYSKNPFGDKEQIELGRFIQESAKKGATVLLSNSDPKNADENDNFFDDLYSSFFIERVCATRMVNANAQKRGVIKELLVTNMASAI